MKLARRILFVAFCLACLVAVAVNVEAIVHHGSTLDLWLRIVVNVALPMWIYQTAKVPALEAERDEARAEVTRLRSILILDAEGIDQIDQACERLNESKRRLPATWSN